MIIKTVVVLICLHASIAGFVAAQKVSKPPRVRTISLERFGEYPNRYKEGTFKIANVVLEDVRSAGKHETTSVFQVYDPRSGVRRGEQFEGEPFHPHDFLICSGPEVSKRLFEEKDKWLNRRVNLYAVMLDVGLTVYVFTGYVKKIELLDANGKVVQTIAGDW